MFQNFLFPLIRRERDSKSLEKQFSNSFQFDIKPKSNQIKHIDWFSKNRTKENLLFKKNKIDQIDLI